MLKLHRGRFVEGSAAQALVVVLLLGTATWGAGCSQRLSKPPPASAAQFRLKETTKTQVLDALGLPTLREVDGKLERWGYAAGPVVSAVDVPSGVAPHALSVETISLLRVQNIVLIYIFDPNGLLVGVNDLRDKK